MSILCRNVFKRFSTNKFASRPAFSGFSSLELSSSEELSEQIAFDDSISLKVRKYIRTIEKELGNVEKERANVEKERANVENVHANERMKFVNELANERVNVEKERVNVEKVRSHAKDLANTLKKITSSNGAMNVRGVIGACLFWLYHAIAVAIFAA